MKKKRIEGNYKLAWEKLKEELMNACDYRSDKIRIATDYEFPALKQEAERELIALLEIKDKMDSIELS